METVDNITIVFLLWIDRLTTAEAALGSTRAERNILSPRHMLHYAHSGGVLVRRGAALHQQRIADFVDQALLISARAMVLLRQFYTNCTVLQCDAAEISMLFLTG
jgi:hypothetical protein